MTNQSDLINITKAPAYTDQPSVATENDRYSSLLKFRKICAFVSIAATPGWGLFFLASRKIIASAFLQGFVEYLSIALIAVGLLAALIAAPKEILSLPFRWTKNAFLAVWRFFWGHSTIVVFHYVFFAFTVGLPLAAGQYALLFGLFVFFCLPSVIAIKKAINEF